MMADSQTLSRPVSLSVRYMLLYFLVALATVLAVAPDNAGLVAARSLLDPDSYMRLVRIQEALDQGSWFGYVVSRDASGAGSVIPWAHVFDSFILLLRAPLLLVLPPAAALLWAGAISGPVSVGLLGLLCAWAVAPLAQRGWLWLAPFSVALAPSIMGYGQLGCATHHIALAAFVVAACGAAGRAAFGSRRSGILLGLAAGGGIWLSPEAMPFGMMGFGAVFLSWATRPLPSVAAALAAAGNAFLATITVAWLIDPPLGGRGVVALDRLSLVFLCLAVIVCALCWLPRVLTGRGLAVVGRFAVLGLASAAGVALWLWLFPGYLHGLSGAMTAEQAAVLAPSAAEWASLDSPSLFGAVAGPGTLAVLGAVVLAIGQRRSRSGVLWAYAGVGGAACVALAYLHLRFAPYQAAAGAMMLPVLLARVGAPVPQLWQSLLRPGLIAAFLGAPVLCAALYNPPVEYSATGTAGHQLCPVAEAARLLAPYPGAVVLADVNIGPELLYRTQVKIVGSLYLGGMDGFMRLRAAIRARDLDTVPPEFQATGARYVLACSGTLRSPYVDGPETTLFDRLNRGEPPSWLNPVARGAETGWVLYEVAAAP